MIAYWLSAIFHIYLAFKRFRGEGADRPIGQITVPLIIFGLPPSLVFTHAVAAAAEEPRLVYIGGPIASALAVSALIVAYVRVRSWR